jgi:uncharacterized protein
MSLKEQCVIIFAKRPVIGRVKTRLAQTIGKEMARDLYLRLIKHMFDTLGHSSYDIFMYWDCSVGDSTELLDCPFQESEQNGADLGERMYNAFCVMLDSYRKVVIIGCDCPEVSNQVLCDAFDILHSHDVVLGPARDGGYYLIGAHRIEAAVFNDIAWGTASVYEKTKTKILAAGLSFDSLSLLSDIDVYEDLKQYATDKTEVGKFIHGILS